MRFADVVGHRTAIARLARAAADGRVAGAYLFAGPAGIGKRTLAEAFASRLLCATPAGGDACGSCPHCSRIASGVHPDVRLLSRDEERRDIRIEQARELCRWLALRPLMAERKVALLEGAEHLNEHGQNALLKTLEEPPGAAVLLLVTAAPTLLLPTVRSRCQRVRLDPLPTDLVAELLVARGVPAEEASLLAAQADGSPGRALELAKPAVVEARRAVLELLARLPEQRADELSAAAQALARGPTDAALAAAVAWYRDVLDARLGMSGSRRHPDAAAAVSAAAARTPPAVLLRQLEAVCATIADVERNANRQLALETMLLALRDLERGGTGAEGWTARR